MQTLYYNHITILKVIATIFITWFHFKSFAPTPIDKVFLGGMLGNSLFFFCSGYLLSLKKERFFGEWITNKLIRIMPSVWIGTAFLSLITDIKIYNFIYPTSFWFINALIVFYVLFYFFYSLFNNHEIISILLIFMLHVTYYIFYVSHTQVVMDGGGFKIWFYCFIFFLYGYYIKNKQISYNKYYFLVCIISIIAFYAYKELAKIYPVLIFWQFIIQPLILFIFINSALKCSKIISNINISNKIKILLSTISNLTLEIYITQITIINLISRLNLFWIYKIIISIILISIVSLYCNKIANKVSSYIRTIINKYNNECI